MSTSTEDKDYSATQPNSTLASGGEDDADCIAAASAELPVNVKKFSRLGVLFRLGLFLVLTIALAFFRWHMAGKAQLFCKVYRRGSDDDCKDGFHNTKQVASHARTASRWKSTRLRFKKSGHRE